MLPDSKTGRKAIYLNAPALALLQSIPRVGDQLSSPSDDRLESASRRKMDMSNVEINVRYVPSTDIDATIELPTIPPVRQRDGYCYGTRCLCANLAPPSSRSVGENCRPLMFNF
jgi:hypothetical protein